MELEVQKYLRDKGSLESLEKELAISSKRHKLFPNLVLLKYSQIDSPRTHEVVKQCRGIILDEEDNWKVISYPYKRFYNAEEYGADEIDWSNATCYEKLDGSLCTIAKYKNRWFVSTSGSPDASGSVGDFNFTFEDLFWKTFDELYDISCLLNLNEQVCFMFELLTPYNQVIVRHDTSRLILHGARRLDTLEELDPLKIAKEIGWEPIKTYPFTTWADIQAAIVDIDGSKSEGYVVVDKEFRRVKVKSPQYVALSHLKEGITSRRILEIVRTNEGSEFLAYFPAFKDIYIDYLDKYKQLVEDIDIVYQKVKDIKGRKELAMEIKHLPYSGIIFALVDGHTSSIREGLRTTHIDKLASWLGVKE
ncbi:2'-5' RNA ligase [Calothrix sp. FACHB-1219]|uniref:RNA ligase n=1 Tax=unclassified Calothrix TaxID=2619626 RepID=UPI0016854EE6|nr:MULTISPECIES: RNA ligase [unclassified Calothrix]MBD2201819.1 2'-5' RNA ligase [Calothrix sp. FACHB-168]MBD2217505.1 2'-5' RNA ligase [Calothrix sp. FACHB-1219]